MIDLEKWRMAVNEHMSIVDQSLEDRQILKQRIEEHLSQFFEWDDIEYNRDLSTIILKWAKNVNPVIKADNISDIGMDWIIRTGRDEDAFSIVEIEIYPWGVKET